MKDLWEDLEPGSEVVKPPTVAEQLGHWEAPSSAALKRCPCHAAPWGGGLALLDRAGASTWRSVGHMLAPELQESDSQLLNFLPWKGSTRSIGSCQDAQKVLNRLRGPQVADVCCILSLWEHLNGSLLRVSACRPVTGLWLSSLPPHSCTRCHLFSLRWVFFPLPFGSFLSLCILATPRAGLPLSAQQPSGGPPFLPIVR